MVHSVEWLGPVVGLLCIGWVSLKDTSIAFIFARLPCLEGLAGRAVLMVSESNGVAVWVPLGGKSDFPLLHQDLPLWGGQSHEHPFCDRRVLPLCSLERRRVLVRSGLS